MTDYTEKIWVTAVRSEQNFKCITATDLEHSTTFNGYYPEYIRADLVPQWQPIETLPADEVSVLLVTIENGDIIDEAVGFKEGETGVVMTRVSDVANINPTHWMPIPKVPE